MSSRAMYSCSLGGGVIPSVDASDSASDTSEAALEARKLCRCEERRPLPLGGLPPSSGSELVSCFDCGGCGRYSRGGGFPLRTTGLMSTVFMTAPTLKCEKPRQEILTARDT